MEGTVKVNAHTFPKNLIPIDERYPEITERNYVPRINVSCKCSLACIYRKVKDYITYATNTSGKKLMTLFDVGTDIRTFTILWADRKAAYWSCFPIGSLSCSISISQASWASLFLLIL